MAHIKQNVLGVLKGKVGSLSTYSNATGNVARIRTNATNTGEGASRTEKQQGNRVRWANLVNFYKASKPWMPKAFETKKKNRSDYNQFMSINYAFSKAALTKAEAAAGACVVEGFMISQGSLTPVQVQQHGAHWDTNIKLGTLAITADTTVAEFAAAAIANNNFIREGMQLSFVSYQQLVDDLGTPRVICTAYEMLIDTKNTEEKAHSYIPDFGLSAADGVLCTGEDISVGGFAYVLSETVSGRTMVSTQSLILNNATLIAQYTGAEQINKAIESYGLTKNVFLDSDYAKAQGATPQPLYIEKIVNDAGMTFVAGDTEVSHISLLGATSGAASELHLSAPVSPSAVTGGKIEFGTGDVSEALVIVSVTENVVRLYSNAGPQPYEGLVHKLTLTIAGVDYVIQFEAPAFPGEID